MTRQHHDPGTKKRRAREHAQHTTPTPTPEDYARDLVRRGLASKLILDAGRRPHGGGPR